MASDAAAADSAAAAASALACELAEAAWAAAALLAAAAKAEARLSIARFTCCNQKRVPVTPPCPPPSNSACSRAAVGDTRLVGGGGVPSTCRNCRSSTGSCSVRMMSCRAGMTSSSSRRVSPSLPMASCSVLSSLCMPLRWRRTKSSAAVSSSTCCRSAFSWLAARPTSDGAMMPEMCATSSAASRRCASVACSPLRRPARDDASAFMSASCPVSTMRFARSLSSSVPSSLFAAFSARAASWKRALASRLPARVAATCACRARRSSRSSLRVSWADSSAALWRWMAARSSARSTRICSAASSMPVMCAAWRAGLVLEPVSRAWRRVSSASWAAETVEVVASSRAVASARDPADTNWCSGRGDMEGDVPGRGGAGGGDARGAWPGE